MKQQIQAVIAPYAQRAWVLCRKYGAMVRHSSFWRDGVTQLARWKKYRMAGFPWAEKRRVVVLAIIVLLGMFLVVSSAFSSTGAAGENGIVSEEMAVLCIGVVRYENGVQDAFFQRPGEPLDAVLAQQSNAGSGGQNYTVEHRDCYASWQAAADFLTEGNVTLPAGATEQDFVTALMGWKQQQQMRDQ